MAREFIGLGPGRLLLFCSIAMLSNCIRSVNVIRLKIPFQYIWHITPMCVHAPVFTCTHMHLCVHMCICRLDQTWVLFLRSHPFCFQKTGSFTDLELADWVRVTGQQGPGILLSPTLPPNTGITSAWHHAWLFNVGTGDQPSAFTHVWQELYQVSHFPNLCIPSSCMWCKDSRLKYPV